MTGADTPAGQGRVGGGPTALLSLYWPSADSFSVPADGRSAAGTGQPERRMAKMAGLNQASMDTRGMPRNASHRAPATDQLEEGETVLALALCSPPGAIEKQSTQPIRIAVTSRRFLALKTSRMTGRSKGDVDFAVPLRDVMSVLTLKRHAVATMGIPVLSVAMVLLNGETVVFETSGFRIKAMRQFAAVLEAAAQAAPESKYGTSVEVP
jgi:hypothetical protein